MMLKHSLLVVVVLIGVFAVFQLPPIAQPLAYHDFADQRRLWGMPNALNVLSNLPLIAVGAYGWWQLGHQAKHYCSQLLITNYRWFFIFVMLAGFGSAYYHWAPTNETLVGDRLAIALSLMALFTALTGELVNERLGLRLLWPLATLGGASVLVWIMTEQWGQGDLRLYLLVQFLPLLLLLLMLAMFRWSYSHQSFVYLLLLFYGLAKVCEHFDGELYTGLGLISGHTLKHLWVAVAAYGVWWLLCHRRARSVKDQ